MNLENYIRKEKISLRKLSNLFPLKNVQIHRNTNQIIQMFIIKICKIIQILCADIAETVEALKEIEVQIDKINKITKERDCKFSKMFDIIYNIINLQKLKMKSLGFSKKSESCLEKREDGQILKSIRFRLCVLYHEQLVLVQSFKNFKTPQIRQCCFSTKSQAVIST